ncbi:conserved hypothetical protein [Candidatus Terasakiella magnetica]|nr:conserved hypothetical protein [Candidatus Terasakiella magnetica]
MAEGLPIRTISLREHPQRQILAGEVHARPYEPLPVPVRASRLAMVGATPEDERAHLARLLASHGAEPPGGGASYFIRDLGGFRLRWERHAEFSTYTVSRFDDFGAQPFQASALDLIPADWLEALPGEMMTGVHVAASADLPDDLGMLFDGNALVGAKVLWGAGEAWTDFRLHADGFGRFVLRDLGLTRGQTGRLMQRLLEIETYRMMALLAFPLAKAAAGDISRIDAELAAIVTQLADPTIQQNDRELLEHLTRLAAEAEHLDAATSFRLSAAKAYYAIVLQRIGELREERIPGLQTMAEFTDRRLGPAMKTCDSVSDRQQLLARRVSRAGDLLRTRVDIALEEKNRDLLNSMNRRAALQLRLQETVEGLSVVAISYYLLGLIGYLAKGLKAAGLAVNSDLAGLIGLPVVAGAVWLGVHRLRKALVHKGEEG